jgi:hypothetical protein
LQNPAALLPEVMRAIVATDNTKERTAVLVRSIELLMPCASFDVVVVSNDAALRQIISQLEPNNERVVIRASLHILSSLSANANYCAVRKKERKKERRIFLYFHNPFFFFFF